MIIIDTNFFLALYNLNDSNHTRAKKDFKYLASTPTPKIIASTVIEEMITVSKLKMWDVLNIVYSLSEDIISGKNNFYFYKFVDEYLFMKILKLVQEKQYSKLSFIDCSLIAILQEYKDAQLLTYDKELDKQANKTT